MNFQALIAVTIFSGLYTSLWGAFKDCPFEGFKPGTFPRSIYFHLVILVMLLLFPVFRVRLESLGLFQVFFLVMGLERFIAELYKGFFRTEDQDKYFVPSRITFLGKYVGSDLLRYASGTILVTGVFCLLLIETRVTSFAGFFGVAYATGLLVSLGGAYKDAPFEGFKWLKFQRSAVVLAVCSPLFYWISDTDNPVSIGYLIYMNGGLERFVVEYYKTYIQRTMSGKFRPDLERQQAFVDTREKYHYLALVIIVGLVVLYLYETKII
jgi:hypothetical protein